VRRFLRDIWFGFRLLLRRPGFAAAALLSLILGIGLNTSVFVLMDAVFLNPTSVEDPESLVTYYVARRNDGGELEGSYPISHPNFRDLREAATSLDLVIFQWQQMNLLGGDEPLRATGMFVSGDYFEVLGLAPDEGRFFLPEEDETAGSHPVAVLSHGAWNRLFGADPGVVGESVRINGVEHTVVGVAPRGFRGTDVTVDVDFWVPVMMYPVLSPYRQWFDGRSGALFRSFGRLRDGFSAGEAEAELDKLSRDLEEAFPVHNERLGARLEPFVEGTFRAGDRGERLDQARIMVVAVGLILLIACLNVAHLLLVQGIERSREIALRRALGASRGRVAAQLLAENLLLFLLGGLLALPAARLALDLLWRFRPPQFPAGAVDLSLDLRVFAFALALAVVTGLLFGLLPALRASRTDLVSELKEGEAATALARKLPRWLRPRRLVVVGQLALTLVALIGAGLFVRSLGNAYRVDLGFDADRLLAVSLAPGDQGYEEERVRELYRRVEERVEAIPGVSSAMVSENRLLRGGILRRQIFVDGVEDAVVVGGRNYHRTNAVFPGYFTTAGIRLLRGEDFDPSLNADAPKVAIINETLAETLWPGEDAVGRVFHFDFPTEPPVRVIGVAEDARYRHVHEEPQGFVYLSAHQYLPGSATLHVRTEGDPAALLEVVKREVRALAPNLPLADARTMADFVADDLWKERVSASLLAVFGLLALLLSAVGVYGVMARAVVGQRRELAIRQAVGARRGDVVRKVLGDGASVVAVGLVLGVVIAVLVLKLSTAVSNQLIDVRVTDPSTYLLAAVILAAVAFVGCLLPARRAARIQPAVALREE